MTKKRLPTLQISVNENFKRDVEILAMASNVSIKDLLLPLIEDYVANNRGRIERFKALSAIPMNTPRYTTEQDWDAQKQGGAGNENT